MLPVLVFALVIAPQVPSARLTLETEIASGASSADGAFGSVADLAADAAGRVYVLDNLASRAHVYAPSGELLGSFGRRGSAPGDLNRPIRIEVRGEIVTILNPSGTTASFTLEREPLESGRVPFGTQRATRMGLGSYVVTSWGGISRDRPLAIESLIVVREAVEDTLLTAPSSDIVFNSASGRMALPTTLCRPVYFAVGLGGELWVATGLDGRLTEWSPSSTGLAPGRSGTLTPAGAPLPDSTRANLVAALPRQIDPQSGDLYLPATLSSICGLDISPDGTLWLRAGVSAGGEHWQAIDPTTLQATRAFTAPEGVAVSAFSGDKVFAIRLDEARLPYVMVYRIE